MALHGNWERATKVRLMTNEQHAARARAEQLVEELNRLVHVLERNEQQSDKPHVVLLSCWDANRSGTINAVRLQSGNLKLHVVEDYFNRD